MSTILKIALCALSVPMLFCYQPLPRSIASKAVYYVKSQQLDDFSCSYNALFNACNIDYRSGLSNKFFDYRLFSGASLAYAKSHGLNPKGATSTKSTDDLAVNYLGMKNLCNLGFEGNKIIPFRDVHSQIWYSGKPSKAEIKEMHNREYERQRNEFMDGIKKQLDAAAGLTRVMHFICTVHDASDRRDRNSGHAILVSLVQNSSGRALYIFDNMNGRIAENSDIMKFIHYLLAKYSISTDKQFKDLGLPSVWPTLPKRDPRYYYYN